jgi:UDP-3-O-[3-hydroxymyristoyl] glucosamine N-acyltransferase
MPVSLGELAVRFGCELRGDPDTRIERVATLGNASLGSIAFLANPRYRAQLADTRASAVVLSHVAAEECRTAMLVSQNPYATYARIASILHPLSPSQPGIDPSAAVAPDARIDPSAQIGAFAAIGPGASIGARSMVGPHCVVGANVVIADDVRLVARVTLGERVRIGTRSVLHPGAVIGADGFGFAPDGGRWVKVPQLGSVGIGADVEIGANTTVDCGAIDDTLIEDGVKLDNLIQIGHNVRIGAHTAIAGCTGISGSTTIGSRCMIGGMGGIAGHISIADDVVITGASTVSHSVTTPGVYSSTLPVEEARLWRRLVAYFKRGASVSVRLRALERAVGVKSAQDEDHD